MAFCTKCGTRVFDTAKVCGACSQAMAEEALSNPTGPVESNGSEPISSLTGLNGTIELFSDRAELSSQMGGIPLLVAFGKKSGSTNTRTYFYTDISSVEFQAPAGMRQGYLRFVTAGTIRGASGTKNFLAGPFGANKHIEQDVDTLMLSVDKKWQGDCQGFYDLLMQKVREAKQNRGSTTVVNQASSADELLKYKQLLDSGVITQEEFDAKKRQLIG